MSAQPPRDGSYASPKLALNWQADDAFSVTASYGTAFRMPTVTELYQTVTTGPTLTSPNPDLRPEHADSFDVSAVYARDGTRLRLSLFEEDIADALIAQTAPLGGSSTLVSYVQNIDRLRFARRRSRAAAGAGRSGTAEQPHLCGFQNPQGHRLRRRHRQDHAADSALARHGLGDLACRRGARLSLAARYESRLYATIDNSDTVTHTWQGFDSFLVMDARARYSFDRHWAAAIGVDNLNNDRYFLFHPFPQRTVTLELSYAP